MDVKKAWQLSLFGGIQIEVRQDDEWRPGPVQPRPLAVLACLAMADQLHTRDALLALLWPDRPERLARLALRQSLHHLNARLGPGLIVHRGRQRLGLDRERLACDVHRFEAALREGRHRDALTEYRGDFLEGFVLSSQPDGFEDWITSTRLRLLDGAISAVNELSHQEVPGPAGTLVGLGWVHRALALSPYSETLLGRAVELHLRRGDRGGAVQEVQAFSRRLREEVGLGASEQVVELRGRAIASSASTEGGEPPPLRLPEDGLRAELEAVLSGRADWMERSVVVDGLGGASVAHMLVVERQLVDGRLAATVRVVPTVD